MSARVIRELIGSSGATVKIRETDVVKQGANAAEQGKWLQKHRNSAVPRTLHSTWPDDGYVMEKLEEVPWHLIDGTKFLAEMTVVLKHYMWDHPAEAVLDKDDHRSLVHYTLGASYMERPERNALDSWFSSIGWDKLEQCLTHGNCSYGSTMLRRGFDVVLIDPTPATRAIPNLRVSDVGYLLMSSLGYEAITDGTHRKFNVTLEQVANFTNTTTDNDRNAALYFAVVHMLRKLPTITDPDRLDEVVELITKVIRSR